MSTQKSIHLLPDWQGETTPFRHTWEGLVNIDQFRWMVRRDTQEQLKMAHNEIGARHVRAVGMFDDEMRVYGKDPKNYKTPDRDKLRLNWQLVDYVMDSLVDIGISPMFTTTFVPGAMASGEKTVFSTKGRINLPKDFDEWSQLVREAVSHAVQRYGIENVRGWYFEVWNEPNLTSFFDGTQEDFFRLWEASYKAVKSVASELRVGGPSTAHAEWVEELINYGRTHDCEPDYVICHIYNNDSEGAPLSPFDGPQEDKVSKSPHFASGVIRGIHSLLTKLGYKGEVHWNEWGRSWLPCEHNRENASEAAFIVKTMAEVSQLADYFAYWNLSDIYDQVGYGSETFHGNYGMLNLQGLRKPNYHAHQLLSRLGKERLKVAGEGLSSFVNAIAAKDSKSIQLLLYSYDHEPEFSTEELDVVVELPSGVCEEDIVLYRVNSKENNIVALWEQMGKPPYLSREQLEFLREANEIKPAAGAFSLAREGERVKAVFKMESPGLAYIEVK